MEITFSKYLKEAPDMKEINFWDLPKSVCVKFSQIPKCLKLRGESITIKKLLNQACKNPKINCKISSILFYRGLRKLPIRLPLSLDNIHFAELYSLMASEGSKSTEFRIHVPEKFFHDMFVNDLISFFGKELTKYIHQKEEKGFLRTTAPAIIRYLIPVPDYIPKLILKNKDYSKRYLQIAFEAEGSPIINGSKRYISLKRNIDISNIVTNKLDYPEEKRVYIQQLKKDYPEIFDSILENPPKLLLGEHLLLKEHFDIDSIMNFECIRINKTTSGFGKITARWALYIYANNINKFIDKVGFISKKKKRNESMMLKIKGNNPQYFSLKIMKKIANNNIITRSNFVKEMRKLGYVSPQAYIWRYLNKGLLEKIGRARYKLLIN